MATTFQQYAGDGVTRNFSVPFPYLDRAHVLVSLDGVAQPAPEFLTASMVRLPVPPAAGVVVEVRRKTPTGIVPVDFQDGSILAEQDLDAITTYSAYLSEEGADAVDAALKLTSAGGFDAQGRRLVNVADGASPQEAATVAQLTAATAAVANSAAEAAAALAAGAATGSAAGLAVTLQSRAGASLVGFAKDLPLNVRDFPTLQAAIDEAVLSGRKLEGNPGETYTVTTPLTANGALRFDLRGAVVDGSAVPAGATFNERPILKVSGSIGANVLLTADVTPAYGPQNIAIASTAGLTAGDYLLLSSSQLMVDGYGNAGSLRGEIIRVNSVVNATTLQSASGVLFSYATASAAKVQKITPAERVQISNGKIIGGGVGSWHTCLQLNYCTNFALENVSTDGGEDAGITTFYCATGLIRSGTQENCTNPDGGLTSDSGSGYGISLYYASRDIVIDGVKFRNCKRGVTGGARYPAVFNTTRNCVSEGGRNGLGTHEPCWWWTVEDNVISGMTGVGINVRGQFNKIHRNKIFNTDSFGIQVRTFYPNPLGLRGVELVDNYCERTAGVLLDGDATDGRIVDATIKGGEIREAEFNSITARRTDNLIISGVRLSGQLRPGVTDGNAIVLAGSATAGDNSTNVLIDGVEIKDAARYGVLARRTQKLQILNSKVHQAAREAFFLDVCSDSLVTGNRVKGGVVDFTYSIRATNCLKTVVNNNHIEGNGNAEQTVNHGIGFVASSGVCEDNQAVGNTVSGHASAVVVTGTGVNHSVVVGNNGRNCYGGTKFNVTSANQSVANNLS